MPTSLALLIGATVVLSSLVAGFAGGAASRPARTAASPDLMLAAEASLADGKGPAAGGVDSCRTTSASGVGCVPSGTQVTPAAQAGTPPPVSTPAGQWVPVNYSRADTALAYDARDGYVLAFGGLGPRGALGDTWKYQHGNWTVLLTATEPSPRWGAAMSYDDGLASVVLFGGENATNYFGDTWEFAGGIWTQIVTPRAPSARAFAGLTFDANTSDAYTVLFGGANATTTFGDTWTFSNGSWSPAAPATSPPPVSGASFVFDRHIGFGVLFGGVLSGGNLSAATWEYKGGQWAFQTESTFPSARAYAGMAYDRNYSVTALVLFGGLTAAGPAGDTWELVGQAWTLISSSTTGLSARSGVGLAFDGLHQGDFYVVQWGGWTGAAYTADTWNFTGTFWAEVTPGGHPPALTGASLVNVPVDRYSVLFGGLGPLGPTNATWLYVGGSWKTLCAACGPSPRYDAAVSYSRNIGGVVLFGGTGLGGHFFNDTWELVNGVWRNVTSGVAPPARAQAGFDFFPSPLNQSVLFGGHNQTAYLNDTWEFDAVSYTWTHVVTSRAPSARAGSAMTDDAIDGYMLLFGGQDAAGVLSDTWKFLGGPLQTWAPLTPTISPPARAGAQAQYDPYNGYVILTGGYNGTVFYNDTWEFLGGNWTSFVPPAAPPPRANAALGFDRYSKYIVQFGGFTSGGFLLSDTWLWVAFSAQATASPDPADSGVAVAFGVSATAGIQPYSYLWTFADGTSSRIATPYHVYTTPGVYNASVTVSDAHLPLPDVTLANVTVVVNPPLTIQSVSATPSTVAPAQRVAFVASVVGGTRPLAFSWSFGDGSTATSLNASHAYSSAGSFTATFVVNDSIGVSVRATVPVDVVGGPSALVSAQPTATDVSLPVAFSSTPSGGSPPYTFSWLFGDGQGSSAQSPGHVYAAAGAFVAQYWLNDSLGQTFHTTVAVSVVPLPSATAAVVPAAVDVGVPASYSGGVSDGTGPFTYFWSFGDGHSAATANATHAFSAAGTFTAEVMVNDSLGATTSARVTVTVVAGPSIRSFTATPGSVTTGSPVAFAASASGGTGPLTYTYSGLPPGCGAGNVTSFSCSPTASGTYTVHLLVTDHFGSGANATVSLQVSSKPAPAPTFLGLPGDDGYWVLIGIVAALAVVVLGVAYALSRRGPPPPAAAPDPPAPEPTTDAGAAPPSP